MPNILKANKYSFSTKVILSLVVFIFIFIFIKFLLVIPKVQKDEYNKEIQEITRSLFYIKEQMKMATKSIRMQTLQESELIKEKIVSEIKDIKSKSKEFENKELIRILSDSYISKYCGYKIKTKNFEYKKIKGKDLFSKNNTNIIDSWQVFEKSDTNKILKNKRIYLFFNSKIEKDKLLTVGCHLRSLNSEHESFEKDLKSHIQKNLFLMQDTNKSKTIVFLINPNLSNEDNRPLYEKNEILRQKRYKLSKLSNSRTITTGTLSAKEILEARDKEPLEYKLGDIDVITWIVDLNLEKSNNLYTLIHTVNKKDILKKSNSNLFVLLPETLIAITITFALVLFVFRKLFSKINILTNTARKINKGNKEIRTKIKGDDDIGQLGVAFDSMLDSFENNIKILDSKVAEKTKDLTTTLEEKETLLKEIHHRVKNNLAKTITLIELQENEVNDKKTIKALVDIKERIYTMELLHRKLYESKDLNQIPLKDYVIDLVTTISKAYIINERVKIDYEIEDINLSIDTAMPLGLIINELVTNSFKYAFSSNDNLKLQIKITRHENELTMILKDNGKGLKEEFTKHSKTLGLKLINSITRFQLFGKCEYFYEDGAKFIIKGMIKEFNN